MLIVNPGTNVGIYQRQWYMNGQEKSPEKNDIPIASFLLLINIFLNYLSVKGCHPEKYISAHGSHIGDDRKDKQTGGNCHTAN
jgi:hypothetical protein